MYPRQLHVTNTSGPRTAMQHSAIWCVRLGSRSGQSPGPEGTTPLMRAVGCRDVRASLGPLPHRTVRQTPYGS